MEKPSSHSRLTKFQVNALYDVYLNDGCSVYKGMKIVPCKDYRSKLNVQSESGSQLAELK